MTEPAPTIPAAPPPRRRFRFSLRTLLLATLLIASAATLWQRWNPWVLERVLDGGKFAFMSAMFAPSGDRILTVGDDHSARVWNAEDGVFLGFVAKRYLVASAAISSDGKHLALGGGSEVVIWDTASGQPSREIQCGTSIESIKTPPGSVRFSPTGKRIVTTHIDRTVRQWDVESGREIAIHVGHKGPITTAAFSTDGERIVSASTDGTAIVWDTHSTRILFTLKSGDTAVLDAAYSNDGRYIATCNMSSVIVWDAATGAQRMKLDDHKERLSSVAFSPDDTRIVTASGDSTAIIWDAHTGRQLATLIGHRGAVRSAEFSPDSTCIVTSSKDATARIWRRTRSEHGGVLVLPELWLTLIFSGALIFSLVRDRRPA